MSMLLQDLRYGFRTYLKTSTLTAVLILTLGLGIGATTAVFTVVNSVLLRPLPYPNSEQIVMSWRVAPIGSGFDSDSYPWSPRDFQLLTTSATTFKNLGAFRSRSFNLTGSGDPSLLRGLQVSAGFFQALGIEPATGRTFTTEEDQPGHDQVVVLSNHFWQQQYGGNSGIVGKTIDLNGSAYQVIGIMPANFAFPRAEEMPISLSLPREVQLWVPLALPAGARGPDELGVVGRLKPGATLSQAQEEMKVFQKRLENQFPQEKGWLCRTITLSEQVSRDIQRPLLLILGAAAMVLLVACSNVSNLLLARSIGRTQEFTLRAALGAKQGRMIRQLLTESILLAIAGGLLGILLSGIAIHFLKVFGPTDLSRLREVGLDLRVFMFTFAISIAVGVLFGLAPAMSAARKNLSNSLKESNRRTSDSSRGPQIRNAFVISQIALAMVLVIAAGLLIRTYYKMLQTDPGFNPEHTITFELSLPASKYAEVDQMVLAYQRTLAQLQSVPGVQSTGFASVAPMAGAPDSTVIRIPGHTVAENEEKPYANYSFASPGYLASIGTPMLQGRDFLESDKLDSMPVTIINDAMAKKFWPGENPLGKQVGVATTRWPVRTIIGIVGDIKHASLREDPTPEMYVPYTQNEIKIWPSMQSMQFVLRTKADPKLFSEQLRNAVRLVDPDLPVANVATLHTLIENTMTQPFFSLLLLGCSGALAIILACIGLYGVMSYSVRQRTQEIGIRMALGAPRNTIFKMILIEGSRLAGIGILTGLILAAFVTRIMKMFLYGVDAIDPLTFFAVSLLLVGIAIFASYIPAHRAMRIDPMVSLRYE